MRTLAPRSVLAVALLGLLAGCGEGEQPAAASAPPDAAAQARLVEHLADTDVTRRRAAVAALQGGHEFEQKTLVALGRRLEQDEDRWVREGAALALRDQGARASLQVPQLIHALSDEDELVRWRAVEALGRMGVLARGALDPLRTHAEDPLEVEVVRAASLRAIERIEGRAAPPR